MICPNNCHNWARIFDPAKPVTNHHPKCSLVDESLMTVWEVVIPGEEHGCVMDDEQAARTMAGEDPGAPMEVRSKQMHREIFEKLPEFAGF